MGSLWQVVRGLVWILGGDARQSSVSGRNATVTHARGMDMLVAHLSPTRWAQYDRINYFDVVGGNTGRRYRIRHGQVLRRGARRHRPLHVSIVLHVRRATSIGDVMLAQKLALESFEAEAIKVAHMSAPLPMRTLRDLPLQWRLRG
jgi:hypothetical protein